mgnify:CR=1 FL=1
MNVLLPFIIPLGAVAAVAVVMVSLGVLFLSVGSGGTIAIGLAIIILVPLLGALLTRGSKDIPN